MEKFLALALAAGLCAPLFLSAQEKKTPEETFKRLDKNSDNKLSKEEYLGNTEGEKKTKKEDRFKVLDTDKDGFLTLDEYKAGQKKK
jgi:Ca2+-binding EF-hand superfamily protein